MTFTTISFQAPATLSRKLAIEAARRGISRSELLRQAARHCLAECPYCDGNTIPHPDSVMREGGVRYCTNCDEPVLDAATGEPATVRAAGKRVATAADSPLGAS